MFVFCVVCFCWLFVVNYLLFVVYVTCCSFWVCCVVCVLRLLCSLFVAFVVNDVCCVCCAVCCDSTVV